MKKLLISLIIGAFLVLPIQSVHAAPISPDERTLIIQLINLLMEQVKELQTQFNALLAQEQANTIATLPTGGTSTVAPMVITPVAPIIPVEVPIITMSFNGQEIAGDKTVEVSATNDVDYILKYNVSYPTEGFKCSFSGDKTDTNIGSGQSYLRYPEIGTHLFKITCLNLADEVVSLKSITIVVK